MRRNGSAAKRRVLVHGLPYFGKMFAGLMSGDGWEFRYYPDEGARNLLAMARYLAACDVAYQIGGRVRMGKFLRVARLLDKKAVVVHWCGSDTIDARKSLASGNAEPWIVERLHHWAESDPIIREVRDLGLSCELMPLPDAAVPETPSPLPDQFSVLTYVPDARRGELYGLDTILKVASALPGVPFELVGLTRGEIENVPPNLRIYGHISDLSDFYRRASLLWRPVRHDGLSFMVLEALGHGRHVLWTYPFPGCAHVTDADEAREQIVRLRNLHSARQLDINREGVQAIAEKYLPSRVRAAILTRLEQILQS